MAVGKHQASRASSDGPGPSCSLPVPWWWGRFSPENGGVASPRLARGRPLLGYLRTPAFPVTPWPEGPSCRLHPLGPSAPELGSDSSTPQGWEGEADPGGNSSYSRTKANVANSQQQETRWIRARPWAGFPGVGHNPDSQLCIGCASNRCLGLWTEVSTHQWPTFCEAARPELPWHSQEEGSKGCDLSRVACTPLGNASVRQRHRPCVLGDPG